MHYSRGVPVLLRLIVAFLIVGAGGVMAVPAEAAPVVPPHGALVTDEPITDMARLGDRVYLAGGFSHIGEYSGAGVALTSSSGALDRSFPQVDGQVSVVIGDGAGGWYIGGDFDSAGGFPRSNLAHILATGTIDGAFAPKVDGFVASLVRDGTSLFFGGDFSHVDGVPRSGLAAIDTTANTLLPFDARQSGAATELAFLPASDTHPAVLYAGMGQLLALDPVTGDPLSGFTSDLNGQIFSLATDATHLYVGGDGLIAVNPLTGARDATFRALPIKFDGISAFDGEVYFLSRVGGRLLAGGSFNALGGAAGPVVALDPVTGSADRTFRPQVDGKVYDIAVTGDAMWVGGDFTAAGGAPANNLALLDVTTGRRDQSVTPYLDDQVNAIAPGADRIYVGGQFFMAGAVARHGFAAVSAAGATLDPTFAPLHLPGAGTLTAGARRLFLARTQFEGYDPSRRRHPFRTSTSKIVVIDPQSGEVVTTPRLAPVHDLTGLAVTGTEIFVARRRQENRRFPANVIDVLDADTGALRRRLKVLLPGYISRLAAGDGRLYVAGSFRRRRADGRPANLAVMSISPRTGKIDSTFDPHAHGPVYGLAPTPTRLYLSGLFDRVGGRPSHGIAAVDPRLGHVDARFAPALSADAVTSLRALPQDLFVHRYTFSTSFRSLMTGMPDPLGGGGLGPLVTTAVATASGLGVAATIVTKVGGQDEALLSFYTQTAR